MPFFNGPARTARCNNVRQESKWKILASRVSSNAIIASESSPDEKKGDITNFLAVALSSDRDFQHRYLFCAEDGEQATIRGE
jgi:hypothetical protein